MKMNGEVMNGAEYLIKTVAQAGIEVCFANAGTTEIPVVNALDAARGIRTILCLFEGGCSGAADGYGRMKDKPAMTLLHLGPGFANGIANFHNARRAGTPIFNIIGDHATWHRSSDPLLNMDLESLVGTVSGWQRNNESAESISLDAAEGISAARSGQIASLIVPSDHQWAQLASPQIFSARFTFDPVETAAIERAAQLLRASSRTALVLGGRTLRQTGLQQAARICAATGCDLLTNVYPARIERGAGYPVVKKIPYFPEQATAMLAGYDAFVFAGAREPVAFFGYKDMPSILLTYDQRRVHIGEGNQDEAGALEHLADALGAPITLPAQAPFIAPFRRPELPAGALTAEKVCLSLAALQPENAIVIDESLTTGVAYYNLAATVPPYTLLYLTGGAIGQGIPSATGAAVACPDRPVIDFQADGSALYTLQALWTQARENLNVTTLICSNRSYNIIRMELGRAGYPTAGPAASALTELSHPDINWVQLSQGFGVPAVRAVTVSEFAAAFHRAMAEPGPHLIELVLQP
jgi:acetolactate synthase-1/2/3 large subunit